MAPPTGLEPVTSWLTVMRSTDWAMEEYRAKHPWGCIALCWHLPIFPGRRQPSIFGTTELNFCVRYGNRWTLTVINTNYSFVYLKRFTALLSLVTRAGIEPALPAWEAGVLTAWPTSRLRLTRGSLFISPLQNLGAPSGARTRDTLIKSQVLYQLS